MLAITAIEKREAEKERLDDMSIRELRKLAALKDVPLTHISVALEKKDLITMIMRAGPSKNHYGVDDAVRVHSAESIAQGIRTGAFDKRNMKKKKKKKRKSSTSSSDSSKSRKKKSKEEVRKPNRIENKKEAARVLSRSPSVEMLDAPRLALPAPKRAKARAKKAADKAVQDLDTLALPAPSVPATLIEDEPDIIDVAQAGMVAAAALGFNVLPIEKELPMAPAIGLRPSINVGGGGAPTNVLFNGGRVCFNYIISAKCEYGSRCPDAHITDPEEEMRVRQKFKSMDCNAGAACMRQGCLFKHPGEAVDNEKYIPDGQQAVLKPGAGGSLQLSYL